MMVRLALRAVVSRPVRSAVLAWGFGFGIAVMAALLGVGEVVLEQARSPALAGGGDVIVAGVSGRLRSARYVTMTILGSSPLSEKVRAVSPGLDRTVYLVRGGRATPIRVRGGVPSLDQALGDPETSQVSAWTDAPGDLAWSSPDPAEILRAMDRFHPIPDVPARAGSWAEWLYFNGATEGARFYLTFLVGARAAPGRRSAFVRLQLDADGRSAAYAARGELDEEAVLAAAPDLQIGGSRVRLEGLRYRISLDLEEEGARRAGQVGARTGGSRRRLTGEIVLEGESGRAIPPLEVRGARGWLTGYTVPVLSGRLSGELEVGKRLLRLDGGRGYHDHNWGFWEGVTWQWGQVANDDVSLVFGRVRPPADAADPDRALALLAVLGPRGPIAFSTHLTILEIEDPKARRPGRISIVARGPALDLRLELEVLEAIRTRVGGSPGSPGSALEFLQMRGRYRVRGEAGGRKLDFTATGSSETFHTG